MIRLRHLAGLAVGIGMIAACGGGDAASNTTTSEATTTSLPATITSVPVDPTTTSSFPGVSGETLLVVGDWGTGTAPQGAVAGAMQRFADEHDVAAILTTGDNLLSDDAEFIMHPYGWVEEADLEWWITWGNHDVETESRIEVVEETFDDPPRWTILHWGDVDIVILDSNQADSEDQAAFLDAALADSSRPTIVVTHHPPYSCSTHGDTQGVGEEIVTAFDDDVFLMLSGHDHAFQRFESEQVTFIVSGGGGQQLYPIEECPADHPELLAGEELHHFVALTQDGGSIHVEAIDITGKVFDQTTLALD